LTHDRSAPGSPVRPAARAGVAAPARLTPGPPDDPRAAPRPCPSCGARNPGGAEWCGQCLVRFEPEGPAPAGAGSGVEGRLVPGAERVHEVFRASADGVAWTCRLCDATNSLAASSCAVCGVSLAQSLRPPPPEGPIRDPGTAALVSLAWPGAGHAYLGMWGQAIARAVTNAWVLAVTALAAAQQGPAAAMSLVFALAAFAWWAIAAHDAYREALREPSAVLLRGRSLLWVVLGLLLLALVMLLAGVLAGGTS
jgi:ribosomal protein L40E